MWLLCACVIDRCAHFHNIVYKSIFMLVTVLVKVHKKHSDFQKKSLFCSPRLHLFDQKYSKNCEILLYSKTAVYYVNMC